MKDLDLDGRSNMQINVLPIVLNESTIERVTIKKTDNVFPIVLNELRV